MARIMQSVAAWALLAIIPLIHAQLQIRRNTDDCINPQLLKNDWRIWPNSNYMISGTSVTRDPAGNYVISNRANFRVTYFSTYKIVENFAAGETYVLYQCGTIAPASVPGAKVMQIPLTSISADDTSAAEFAKQALVVDRIAFVSELICSSCMQALAVCGYVAPDPAFNPSGAGDIQSQVDAFFTFGKSSNPESVAMSAVSADSPLARAEWLKYVSCFFNREWEAETLFRGIRNTYFTLKRAAQSQANTLGSKKVVLWVYMGWDADYVVSKAPYKLAYVQDAGGVMPADSKLQSLGFTNKGGGTWSIPQARVSVWKTTLKLADVIITEDYEMATGGFVRLKEFLDAHRVGAGYPNTGISAIDNGEVYSIAGTTGQTVTSPDSIYRGSVGLDWFERGTSRCDEVIRDFVLVLTPSTRSSLMNGWTRKWLLKLSDPNQRQIKIGLVCDNDTAKLDSKCVRTAKYPAQICPNTIRNCDPNLDPSQLGCMLYPKQTDRCTVLAAQKKLIRQLTANGQTCQVTPSKQCV